MRRRNPIYSALDALEEAVAALNAKAEDIERIDIATFRFATVMCNPDPPNYFASKYSLPHVAACLVVRGSPVTSRWTTQRWTTRQ
jgi:2-methylcitrate dehydratase PrpD